jgi:hypothetical protein
VIRAAWRWFALRFFYAHEWHDSEIVWGASAGRVSSCPGAYGVPGPCHEHCERRRKLARWEADDAARALPRARALP